MKNIYTLILICICSITFAQIDSVKAERQKMRDRYETHITTGAVLMGGGAVVGAAAALYYRFAPLPAYDVRHQEAYNKAYTNHKTTTGVLIGVGCAAEIAGIICLTIGLQERAVYRNGKVKVSADITPFSAGFSMQF